MKKTALLLAVGALAALSSNAFAVPSLIMHSPNTGSNYVSYSDLKTPVQADAFCKAKQGHLAVINNHQELVDLANFLGLLFAGGPVPVNQQEVRFLLGTSVQLGAVNPVNVTNQPYFFDATAVYEGWMQGQPASSLLSLQFNSFYNKFEWSSLGASTTQFICEFEDAPI